MARRRNSYSCQWCYSKAGAKIVSGKGLSCKTCGGLVTKTGRTRVAEDHRKKRYPGFSNPTKVKVSVRLLRKIYQAGRKGKRVTMKIVKRVG